MNLLPLHPRHLILLVAAGVTVGLPNTESAPAPAGVIGESGRQWEERYVVSRVRSYGWRELADSTRPLTAEERAKHGAVLGNIAAIARGPGSELYVLDRDFQKVVVFSADGQFQRLLGRGYGRGPGEFVRPRALAVAADGRVAVLDDAQGRLTLFDSAGDYLAAYAVPRPFYSIAFDGNQLLATSSVSRGDSSIVQRLNFSRGTFEPAMTASGRYYDLNRAGEPGALGRNLTGQLLYGMAIPGSWVALRDGRIASRHGDPAYRWLVPEVIVREPVGELTTVLLGTRAIGQLSSGDYLTIYTVRPNPARPRYPDDVGSGTMGLIQDPSGQVVQLMQLLPDQPLHFVVTPDGFLVVSFDPYPEVVEYTVRKGSEEDRSGNREAL